MLPFSGCRGMALSMARELCGRRIENRFGAPWQNPYFESFFSRLRTELLEREVYANLREAQALAQFLRDEYNEQRPHNGLGYLTPKEFVKKI